LLARVEAPFDELANVERLCLAALVMLATEPRENPSASSNTLNASSHKRKRRSRAEAHRPLRFQTATSVTKFFSFGPGFEK
jgi:hypothetical protein